MISFIPRYGCFQEMLGKIEKDEKHGMEGFTSGFKEFGHHVLAGNSVVWKEWCPGAQAMYLWGDFSECSDP